MTVRVNITLPEKIYEKLSEVAGERGKSKYISDILMERFRQEEEKKLKFLLIEGYSETKAEDRELNKDWEAATLENWK